MTRLIATFRAILEHCVAEHGMTAPIVLEVIDASGKKVSARYREDQDPELLLGRPGRTLMEPPLRVIARDHAGHVEEFTLDLFEPEPPTVHYVGSC